MSQTEVQLIKNGAVVDADINGMSSSKLSGALPAISGASLTNLPAGAGKAKNLIINGAMQVAQRGTSSTTSGYGSVDRWQGQHANTGVTVTHSQQTLSSSDTPYQSGFGKFFRLALSGAGTANANAYLEMQYRTESQDMLNSGWNYKSSSSFITMSFWFRCSTNQTFLARVFNHDSLRGYDFSFTASGNNAWTKITKTIPGNSNLVFNDDTGIGLRIHITPFYGTDYTNNLALDQWITGDPNNQFPDMASTWLTAGASTFDITGVQLEVGSVATDFEHMSFGEQLALCQRYFYEVKEDTFAFHYRPDYRMTQVQFPQQMRATPTVSATYEPTTGWTSYQPNNTQVTLYRLQGEDQSNTYVRALKLDSEL